MEDLGNLLVQQCLNLLDLVLLVVLVLLVIVPLLLLLLFELVLQLVILKMPPHPLTVVEQVLYYLMNL